MRKTELERKAEMALAAELFERGYWSLLDVEKNELFGFYGSRISAMKSVGLRHFVPENTIFQAFGKSWIAVHSVNTANNFSEMWKFRYNNA